MNKSHIIFFNLIRAGLWENLVDLGEWMKVDSERFKVDGSVDWGEVFRMAEEQSVVGLVAAGVNLVNDEGLKENGLLVVPKRVVLKFIGRAMQLEHRNVDMNHFIGRVVDEMRNSGIEVLLVKGQGVAQCYERPLWRASGDVDFLFDDNDMGKADAFFSPLSSYRKFGGKYSKEIGYGIDPWVVEAHGSLRTGLSARVDEVVDTVQEDVLANCRVRIWMNEDKKVFLPAPNHDIFLVFTHFIKHFYKEGLMLRQICDWARLLWTYREEIDVPLLESWVKRAGLMKEWQAFASLAIDYLGMPTEAMPMFGSKGQEYKGSKVQGGRLIEFILGGYSGNKLKDTLKIAKIFPWKALRYSPSIFLNVNGMKVMERVWG